MAWLLCVGIGGGGAVQFRNVWCDDEKFNETDIQKYSETCGGVIISATKVSNDKRPNYSCWNCQGKLISPDSVGGFCCRPCRIEFFEHIFDFEIKQMKTKSDEELSKMKDKLEEACLFLGEVLYQEHGSQRERGGAEIIYCGGLRSNERACIFLEKCGKAKKVNDQTFELVKEPEK